MLRISCINLVFEWRCRACDGYYQMAADLLWIRRRWASTQHMLIFLINLRPFAAASFSRCFWRQRQHWGRRFLRHFDGAPSRRADATNSAAYTASFRWAGACQTWDIDAQLLRFRHFSILIKGLPLLLPGWHSASAAIGRLCSRPKAPRRWLYSPMKITRYSILESAVPSPLLFPEKPRHITGTTAPPFTGRFHFAAFFTAKYLPMLRRHSGADDDFWRRYTPRWRYDWWQFPHKGILYLPLSGDSLRRLAAGERRASYIRGAEILAYYNAGRISLTPYIAFRLLTSFTGRKREKV